jgi:alpha-galactosidase
MLARLVAVALAGASAASALDNGFVVPARGWSSWYAAPDGSQVTDAFVRASARALVSSGLAAKGYVYVNVDEGWLQGRYAGNNSIYEDRTKFPAGMAALGAFVNSLPTGSGVPGDTMRYGLYSCRGTCQCGTDKYSGPGSHGFEAADTAWMIAAGAKWLKIDSCCGDQNHSVAFSDYAKFRDAMNASGTQVWFNLCGWNPWYAPADPSIGYPGGFSLGNSYRIWGDGGSWGAITGAINTMAAVGNWTRVGGYPDPDNILGPHGTVGTVSESQARVQMVLWSLAPTQLIIGEDVTQMSAEFVETLSNDELLAVNADAPFVGASRRIVGGDLTWPCSSAAPPGELLEVHTLACDPASAAQAFFFNLSDNSLRPAANPSSLLATATCDFADGDLVSVFAAGGGGASGCGGAVWVHAANNSIVGAAGKCLDEYEWTTPRVDLWTCVPGATNEAWAFKASGAPPVGGFAVGALVNADSGLCLATTPAAGPAACTNVWARPLANGDVALAFVNNGDANATVQCDAACFAAAGLAGAAGIRVRDMIAHADLPQLAPPFALAVPVGAAGAAAALRLTPV